ncbi:MAG: hypothetical protein NTW08_08290 [Gammaproteobacteria bacterium]|nr:hypothetical protein [Gammaproteobacteria bacterium]
MNQRNLVLLCIEFILIGYQSLALSQPAQLFNLQESGTPSTETVQLYLCLNGNGPLTCQAYTANSETLSVNTTIPNHTYHAAGIKINTPGYILALSGINCVPNQYGYCIFKVSDLSPALFTLFTSGWDAGTTIDNDFLQSVSCPSNSFCMAIDSSGKAIRYDGTSWGAPTAIGMSQTLNAISCSSSSFCMAVGYNGKAAIYNGTNWTQKDVGNRTVTLTAVSCVDSSFCMAVGTGPQGVIYKYNNGAWASPIRRPNALYGVSCPTTTFCMAVGDSSALEYNNGAWSSGIIIDNNPPLTGVSCPNSSFCMAVDDSGFVVNYSNDTWGPVNQINTTSLKSVSCPSNTFCMVVDDTGLAYNFNSQTWSSGVEVGDSIYLTAVSCPNSSFCMAVGMSLISTNNAYSYRN